MKAEKAKQADAATQKKQKDATSEVHSMIEAFQCYRQNGGGIDFTATEMVKAELRAIKCADKVKLAVFLATAIQNLPDYPRQGDVYRVVEQIKNRMS